MLQVIVRNKDAQNPRFFLENNGRRASGPERIFDA